MLKRDLILAVLQHAVDNYEEDGWDIVVECWSDDEIGDCVQGAESEEEAISLVAEAVKPIHEYRMEIRNA